MTTSAILAQHHLLEAKRIFVDAGEAGEAILPGLYNLLCDIFESTNFASNSATFNGLISALNELPEAQTLHLYYFHNMSLSQIASLSSSNESLGATTLSRKRALKQLFHCAHNFYLPERQKHLEHYNKFLTAVLVGSPVDDDLSVKAIGLSTRTSNALYRAGIFTASQLYFASNAQLIRVRNLGIYGLDEIAAVKKALLTGNI